MADSQNGLDTGLNIDAQFATNSVENPYSEPPEKHLENSHDNDLDNGLWQYACQVYSQAGVEAALLTLQDDHGADINLILQALWLASEGRAWTEACIPADYDQWIAEQVLPLRKMRRSMKVDWPEQEGFRQRVKNLELKAEQYGLEMLFEGGLQEDVMKDDEIKSEAGFVNSNLIQLAQYLNIPHNYFESLISLI